MADQFRQDQGRTKAAQMINPTGERRDLGKYVDYDVVDRNDSKIGVLE